MNKTEPAFPCHSYYQDGTIRELYLGLTIRQFYAVEAMKAFIPRWELDKDGKDFIVRRSFEYADAMIAFEESEK